LDEVNALENLVRKNTRLVSTQSRWPWPGFVALLLGASACDSVLHTDDRPVINAQIQVTGTSPVPLLLVTSTNFRAERNIETNQLSVFPVSADTVRLTVPYDRSLAFNGADRLFVKLVNPDLNETASIRLRVVIDGKEMFNESAAMRDASLNFTFFNFPF
jgi:hypothetical protein